MQNKEHKIGDLVMSSYQRLGMIKRIVKGNGYTDYMIEWYYQDRTTTESYYTEEDTTRYRNYFNERQDKSQTR